MKRLYRLAGACVSIARRVAAAFHFTISVLLLALALWLVVSFDASWFLLAVAALIGLSGFGVLVTAAETFLTTKPPERPAQPQPSQQQRTRR
jgi:hypothetical protein